MLPRVRANRRWRFALEAVGALVCVAAGPHVVSALASTGAPTPEARPRAAEPSLFARRLAALAASMPTRPSAQGLPEAAPEALSPQAARLRNAAVPISDAPNPAAQPFQLEAASALDEARATDCMTAAVYYEAGQESADGQRAVAQVVLNRLRDPQFPKTVCDVVFQGAKSAGCQFTFTCDGALDRPPTQDGWSRAHKVAVAALHGDVMRQVGAATHYHADYVAPGWSPALTKVAVVGQHIFYRWPEGARRPPAGGGRVPWDEPVLQVATLDDAPPGPDMPTPAPPPLSARPVAIAAARPVAPAVERAADRMADAGAAAKAGPILTPKDLDWQGRPRPGGPPRLARPDSF